MKTYDFGEKLMNPRAVLQECFMELAEKDDRFIVISPDISRSTMEAFYKKYPDKHLNLGIAEQDSIDFASGMAMEGKIPFVYGMAAFMSMRCCEQVRTSVCYQRSNVKIVAYSSGLTGNGGSTHYSLEDLGIMRLFPGMKLMLPGDPQMVRPMLMAAYEQEGPVYIRIGGSFPESCVYRQPADFEIGRGIEVTDGGDAAIIATGIMVAYALDAAKKLAAEGIRASVIDMHTLKPIDRELVVRKAAETGRVVTVEDHNILGGLGTAVAEILAEENLHCCFAKLGVPDVFPGFGAFDAQAAHFGFDAAAIAAKVKAML